MKMRFGNTFVDPLAGIGQATTFLARELSGEKITTKGKIQPLRAANRWSDFTSDTLPYSSKPNRTGDDMGDILGRFLRTKLAPIPGAVWNSVTGKNVVGQETDALQEAKNLVTPMSMRNIVDVMQENGVPKGTAITLAELLGMSVQYRDPDTFTKEKK
jgi:hypothetical protein